MHASKSRSSPAAEGYACATLPRPVQQLDSQEMKYRVNHTAMRALIPCRSAHTFVFPSAALASNRGQTYNDSEPLNHRPFQPHAE